MVTGQQQYQVSIIIATFNSLKFLPRSVGSVLNQTFKDYELILVDDGSTDKTFEFLFPYLLVNDNFKYIRHSNRKHPLSLNAGITNSSGEFITFLDADDEYTPEHIELRVEYMEQNKEIDLLHSPALLLGGNDDDFLIPDANDMNNLIHINECIIGGTLFGKRAAFVNTGGFKNVYSHDSEFVKRVSADHIVQRFEHPTYIYHRDNPHSITSSLRRTS